MTLREADDFLEETEALDAALEGLDEADYARPTQFKGWTLNDVLVHLHFWNGMADLAAADPDGFAAEAAQVTAAFAAGTGLRPLENAAVAARGEALRAAWRARARDMASRWAGVDPKARLPWIGPTMSARSAITARQMETWAHGFEVFDLLGLVRTESDRLRNIVVLGVNTFAWSHQVQGLPVPDALPRLELTAPSGAVWSFGAEQTESPGGSITGPAVDFAAVVTQTRALEDTALVVEGPVAATWMAHAQCFAGPPEAPPAKGSRHRR